MSRSSLILSLAKVIIAAAWADGEISNDEINSLKDLLFHLPDITGREWAMLEMYIDAPVSRQERARLIAELQDELRSASDRDFALEALDKIIRADGTVSEREKLAAQEIRQAIEESDTGLFGMMNRLIKGPVTRRTEAAAVGPNREKYFEDYIKNRVYYGVKVRQDTAQEKIDLPNQELRRLSLAAGLMARVAHVDDAVSEHEKEAIAQTLVSGWDVDPQAAEFVAEVAIDEISPEMDYYRLTRSFFEQTSEAERIRFLDVLFAVAAADGFVSSPEIEEIRALSLGFKLPHKTFIEAKVKVAREKRAN